MIPIGDNMRRRTVPWVTYGIIVINVAVFAWMLGLSTSPPAQAREFQRELRNQTDGVCYGFETLPTPADHFVCKWGFQPQEWFENFHGESDVSRPDRPQILLTLLSALFLHAGWLHIIGNMLFLWVFGDDVEDRLGHMTFLAFYLVAGMVASLVQAVVDVSSIVPVLGASGAVAGVLGAYLLYFPRATVKVVIPFFILILIPIPIPAVVMIGLWFAQNLLAGYASISDAAAPDQATAWFAHIGGFVFGMLVALFAKLQRTRERRPQRS